ncbi:MAG: linear amide C-N hydrolase, partial [Bacteroidales bacterium]|nr:linear amide C-N hydrolase [Candidatus Equimonas faecalis]
GFVCHNPQGQLLFGRNMDSGSGNLIVTFHAHQKSGYKFVMMTNQAYVDAMNGIKHDNGVDGIFMDGKTDLSLALRQPILSLDGMNEHGLCFAGYQLPGFDPEKAVSDPYMQMPVDQNTGKPQITVSTLHYLILSKCKTVDEVEAMLKQYDYVTIWNSENVHWYVADATGKYAVIEYWGKGTPESPFKLNVMTDALTRYIESGNTT